MPRSIHAGMTLDSVEEEILYTVASLAADPDARDLVALTDGWHALLEGVRTLEREARRAMLEGEALRSLASGRLDGACEVFGEELYRDLLGDPTSPRYTRFFSVSPSRSMHMALPKKIAKVRSWLLSTDPVLERHRAALDAWSMAALAAMERMQEQVVVRGELWVALERLREELTRERDGLRDALAARAKERGLARSWPELFFRGSRRNGEEADLADGAMGESPVVA
jgi:hypothetical protein